MSESVQEKFNLAHLYWYDRKLPLRSRRGNVTPLGFIQIIQQLYRRVRPTTQVSPDRPVGEDSLQLPHVSIRTLSRNTYKDGKTPKLRMYESSGVRIEGQSFVHTMRFYVHGETYVQAELEAQALEHLMRDYRGWLKDDMGIVNYAFDGGGSDQVVTVRGQEIPTIYRDYTVVLEELKATNVVPIEVVKLISARDVVLTTEHYDVSNVGPLVDRQELTYPPIWVTAVRQGPYVFVEGLDYQVMPFGIVWIGGRPLPFEVEYYYAPQAVLDIV